MKLRQLLKAHFDTNGPTKMTTNGKFNGVLDYIVNPNVLSVYLDELNQCIEFNGSRVEIVPDVKKGKPKRVLAGYDEEGVPSYQMKLETVSLNDEPMVTVKLGTTTKFAPVVKIFSIALSPEIFDASDLFTTKVDTAYITPSIMDPETLQPTKRIVVTFSPEVAQDAAIKLLKKEIKETETEEIKPEFKLKIEDVPEEKAKEEVDKQINENADEAKGMMETISKDEIKIKIHEQEEQYLQTLLELVQNCFREPSKHALPSKRAILLRLTADSLVENDKPTLNPADTVVVLK